MARTAYYGIVPFMIDGVRVYAIAGNLDLDVPFGSMPSSKIYNDEWDQMNRYLDFSELYCKPGKYEIKRVPIDNSTFRWTGKCDPNDPDMIEWFKKRNQSKRLAAWGKMIVF